MISISTLMAHTPFLPTNVKAVLLHKMNSSLPVRFFISKTAEHISIKFSIRVYSKSRLADLICVSVH
jgi:hypothetical protein